MITSRLYSESLQKFEKTISLLSENKLNSGNAFDNRIMDEINILFSDPSFFLPEKENLWQKYSIAISSVGRIYGYCVESLFGEVSSFLQGLRIVIPVQINPEKSDRKERLYRDNMMDLEMIERCEMIESSEHDVYFKKLANQAYSEESGLGLLNCLRVNNQLDLMLDANAPHISTCDTNEEVNLEGLITYSMCELENLELMKGCPTDVAKFFERKPMDLDSCSSDHGAYIENNFSETSSININKKLERIELFDDFNYIKQTESLGKNVIRDSKNSRRNKTQKKNEAFSISEENVPENIVYSDNIIPSNLLTRWTKEPPELNFSQKFSSSTFFSLDSRPFTKLKNNRQIEIVDNYSIHDEEILVNKGEEKPDISATMNFINIREIKRVILAFINSEKLPQYELNYIKEKTVPDIDRSLFVVAVLHLCNDHCFLMTTIGEDLFLIVQA